jgi:site-specific recombinase
MEFVESNSQIRNLLDLLRINYKKNEKPFSLKSLLGDTQTYQDLGKEVFELAISKKYVSLLSDSGIADFTGILSQAFGKIGKKILPEIHEEQDLLNDINQFFFKKDDYKWLNKVPDEHLAAYILDLKWPNNKKGSRYIKREILNTVVVLAQKIGAIGIEREVVSKISSFDDLDSPFLGLNREVTLFVEKILSKPDLNSSDLENDFNQIMVMLSQCQVQMGYLYKHKDKYGISLKMTVLIRKLEKYLSRLKDLLVWIQTENPTEKALTSVKILKEIVYTYNTKNSLRKHFSNNLEFMSYKIVENTSKSGENFIAANKQQYWSLFRKALGGGVIVAFLCWFKTAIYYFNLPTFWTAFFYSLNYAFGFVLIHVCRFTLATKQPAMTASTIAESLSNNGKNPDWLNKSTKLLTRQIRSQFVSLVGNAIIAFPVAFVIGWVFYYFTGTHIADPVKAQKLIWEINIFKSPAVIHAAIAGVYLMLSGLISGYYENMWVYNNIHKRTSKNATLIKVFGEKKVIDFANYMEKNIGGISGNVFLGIFLGSTAAIGSAFGIPADIRHVTFASGNFGLGYVGHNNIITNSMLVNSLLGIVVIGLVNVLVSFGLSILIALNSRGTKFFEIKQLFKKLILQFFSPTP